MVLKRVMLKKILNIVFLLDKIVYIWSTKLVNQFGKPK